MIRISMASSLLRLTVHRSFSMLRSYSPSPPPIRRAVASQYRAKMPSFLSLRFASSEVEADESLKQLMESEIECQENEIIHGQVAEMPIGFPFEIIDNPGEQTVVLKSEFEGENIYITVLMNDEDEAENDEDKSEDERDENLIQPNFSLFVNIDKGVGSTMEFCCNLHSDELVIESMEMKRRIENDDEEAFHGPLFRDLDESLQNALYEYIRARGIKNSLFGFLSEYMINKDDREYLLWLRNLKGFVEK